MAALMGIIIFVPAPKAPSAGGNGGVISPVISPDGRVKIDAPSAHAAVSSPVKISGSVTGGGWFFEGSFPVKVVDANGAVLGSGQAQALFDWMSTGTVPFSAAISFAKPHSSSGAVVFSKDNPSGLPQNDMSFEVPIIFSASSAAR